MVWKMGIGAGAGGEAIGHAGTLRKKVTKEGEDELDL